MNDAPGLAAWDLANARTAPLDAAVNERLARQLARERDPEAVAEAHRLASERATSTAQQRSMAKLANVPHWPSWAPHPIHAPEGRCGTCHEKLSARGKRQNLSGICSGCAKRLGKNFRRTELGLRLFRAGEWKPGEPRP